MSDPDKKIILEIDDAAEDELRRPETERVLVFRIGSELYGVAIAAAKEVIVLPEMTRVPNVPEFVRGVINLRGAIVAVLDIRSFVGLAEAERSARMQAIITDVAGSAIGILIDAMRGTLDVAAGDIQPPIATLKSAAAAYTKGEVRSGAEIVTIVDLALLLKSPEIEALRKQGGR